MLNIVEAKAKLHLKALLLTFRKSTHPIVKALSFKSANFQTKMNQSCKIEK